MFCHYSVLLTSYSYFPNNRPPTHPPHPCPLIFSKNNFRAPCSYLDDPFVNCLVFSEENNVFVARFEILKLFIKCKHSVFESVITCFEYYY